MVTTTGYGKPAGRPDNMHPLMPQKYFPFHKEPAISKFEPAVRTTAPEIDVSACATRFRGPSSEAAKEMEIA
jgi:hypothetical protein